MPCIFPSFCFLATCDIILASDKTGEFSFVTTLAKNKKEVF